MIDITPYLSKDATLRKPSGVNQYGESSYTDETIRVRWEGKRRLVRDAQGNQSVSEAMVFTDSEVSAGDAIVDLKGVEWSVIAVSEYHDLDGNVSHFEVSL